jgi:glycosyltransferase involved in cell wall biosynthesis
VQRHLITCEFPPQPGGVSDYTYAMAKHLAAAGDEVHVWCTQAEELNSGPSGVTIHKHLGELGRFAPRRWLFVQWVPHGYGCRSLNLWFCLWLLKRSLLNRDHVELMIHEPFLRFGRGASKQAAAALIHRIMIVVLLGAAARVWVSTAAWKPLLLPYLIRRKIPLGWLPVPSNIPVHAETARVQRIRRLRGSNGRVLLGHFGTYGPAIAAMLLKTIAGLFDLSDSHLLLLMGKGSREFHALLSPLWRARIHATGLLDAPDLSCHIQACDVMLQPYPDGISTRRGSAMAALAHGRALVTTDGPLTESFWSVSGAIAMTPLHNSCALAEKVIALMHDEPERKRLQQAALALYADRFEISHTIKEVIS